MPNGLFRAGTPAHHAWASVLVLAAFLSFGLQTRLSVLEALAMRDIGVTTLVFTSVVALVGLLSDLRGVEAERFLLLCLFGSFVGGEFGFFAKVGVVCVEEVELGFDRWCLLLAGCLLESGFVSTERKGLINLLCETRLIFFPGPHCSMDIKLCAADIDDPYFLCPHRCDAKDLVFVFGL